MLRIWTFALACTFFAATAAAHGPTVRVSNRRVTPPTLTIFVGDTVHFHNANAGTGTCTVVADDGSFESPTLARAAGWHHKFPEAGVYPFTVREFPGTRGTIKVVPRPESEGG
ncbi:MAG: hypothetical protein MJE66_03515 [Proteobacteria bacterium]|nr:hypothetical protein [Pseudomonadota bacterium]